MCTWAPGSAVTIISIISNCGSPLGSLPRYSGLTGEHLTSQEWVSCLWPNCWNIRRRNQFFQVPKWEVGPCMWQTSKWGGSIQYISGSRSSVFWLCLPLQHDHLIISPMDPELLLNYMTCYSLYMSCGIWFGYSASSQKKKFLFDKIKCKLLVR